MNLSQLIVQQNNTYYERVDPYDIEVIYNAYKNSTLDKLSNMKGAIESNFAYKSHCDELKNKYKSLKIQVNEYYHEWSDAEFQRCISLLHGDGTGVINADLIKQINLNSNAMNGVNTRPFYGNKKVKIIDMRPFQNFKYTRSEGTNSNLCVVKNNDNESEYQLKEVYLTSKNVSGFTPFSFIEAGNGSSNTYFLDKVWYEGVESKNINNEQIYGHAGNYNRCGIEHFYWLNHSECIGYDAHRQITMPDGTIIDYIIAGQGNWNSRGSFMMNIILDSPVPIVIGSHTWGNGRWGQTKLWVPDNQLDAYNYLYAYHMSGEMPASISTMSNYNSVNRQLANWWVYPGKTTYQVSY